MSKDNIIAGIGIGVIATVLVAFTSFRDDGADAQVTGNDTIVGIDPGGVTDAKRLALRPEGWAQPVYSVWVSAECADTLSVGDNWPSATAVCQ